MSLNRHIRRGTKLLSLLKSGVYRRGLRHGVGAAIEHEAVVVRLNPAFVIDVGANVGQFSLLVRKAVPAARIVAFEPLRKPAARYRALFAGDVQVVLHACALGRETAELDMHVSAREDSSSLLPISSVQAAEFPGTQEVGTEKVKAAPMTALLSAADLPPRTLLKIDVQGYELEVLQSAEPLLPHMDWIYLEASFVALYEGQPLADDIIAYLAGQGFQVVEKGNLSYGAGGALVQADYLFRNAGRV